MLFNRATWHYDPVLATVNGRSKALRLERQRWADGATCPHFKLARHTMFAECPGYAEARNHDADT